MQNVKGGTVATKTCGGTAGVLPMERSKATFDVNALKMILYGGEERYKEVQQWRKIFDPKEHPEFDFTYDIYDERKVAWKKSLSRTFAAHKIAKSKPDMLSNHMQGRLSIGNYVQNSSSAAGNHFGIFVGALQMMANDEQLKKWFRRAINMEITGAYAQTELGHGSNVRALETTATYDEKTKEFVIDSPTLSSLKWWPGCFGLMATHAIVYARLILKGKDHGIQAFMVQLRDENHDPMPGIDVGDIGPKMGYNLVDNGYCRFDHVRIPRDHMLSKYKVITDNGELQSTRAIKKGSAASSNKLKYLVMIRTRVGLAYSAYSTLAKACTIAIRYSAVRIQGFKNTRQGSLQSGENQVLDYKMQQYRLFKWLSMSYAFYFVAEDLIRQLFGFYMTLQSEGDVSGLPELHASSAALKAFLTNYTGDGIEECRRCCGGHGSTMNSGIAKLVVDYNSVAPIAEGDKIILVLQTARFLVRAVQAIRKGAQLKGSAAYLTEKVPKPDFNDPFDLQKLLEAFKFRAQRSAIAVTDSFEERMRAGEPFDQAWNNCAVDLVKAAQDHTFVLILAMFIARLEETKNDDVRGVLTTLAQHFALVQIRENGADWTGFITRDQVASVNKAVFYLLGKIRRNAVPLVDAFGFTDNDLKSAIGRYDGNVYEALFDYAKKSPLNDKNYIREFWEEYLKPKLDIDYIKQGKQIQRAGHSKL